MAIKNYLKNKINMFRGVSVQQETWLLLSILLIALILRFWGIDFGLPFTYHVDEPTYVSAALNLGAGNIGLQLNPPVLSNILFLEYGLYFLVERLSGNIISVAEFDNLYRTDPSIFFLLGRITMAIFGVLNVWIVYLIGKKVFSQSAGLIAAFFLAISFLHVRDSHFAVPDVLMTLLVTIAIYFCLISIIIENRAYFFLAAFFSGMAVASKWSAWPILLPLGYVFILNQQNLNNSKIKQIASCLGISLICFFAGFFLPAFQLLLKPGSYFTYALHELRAGNSGGFGIWQIDTVPGYLFYLKILYSGIGVLLLIFGILGFCKHSWLSIFNRNKASLILILFPLTYYIFMGASRHYFARYVLPIIPFLVVLAGEFVTEISTYIEMRRWKMRAVLIFFIVSLSVQPLLSSIRFDFLLTRTDTRTIAKKWIEEHIPVGSKIGLDWPIHTPSLNADEYDINFESGIGLASHPVEYYREEKYDYVISSSFISEIDLVVQDMDIERKEFYASLSHETHHIITFYPRDDGGDVAFIFDELYGPIISLWERERPGPIINVYKINGNIP